MKPPELHLLNPHGLSPIVLRQLTNSLQQTAKQLQGQEMMYDLSDHVRAFLANHNAPPSAISKLTLHEQMVIRNEQDLKVEREREMEERDRKRKEREAELRVQSDMMNEKIQQDLERKREHARAARQQRQELGFTDGGEDIVDDDYHAHLNDDPSSFMDTSEIKLIHFENLITLPIAKEEIGMIPKVTIYKSNNTCNITYIFLIDNLLSYSISWTLYWKRHCRGNIFSSTSEL